MRAACARVLRGRTCVPSSFLLCGEPATERSVRGTKGKGVSGIAKCPIQTFT